MIVCGIIFALFLFGDGTFGQENDFTAFLSTASFMDESSFQQESANELKGYEQLLLEHNPDLRSAWSAWQSSLSRITAMKSLPDPQLQFGYFLEPVQTAVGPQRYRFGLRQMIPWPGKLAVSSDIQREAAEAAFSRFRSSVESLLLRFRQLYVDAWYLDRVLETSGEHLSLLKNQEEVITVRYRSEAASHADLIQTEIERIRIEDDLASLASQRRTLQAEMKSLLNGTDGADIVIADSLIIPAVFPARNTLLELVRRHNPDVLRAGVMVRQARRRTSLARLQAFPDFSIGLDVIETGPRLDGAGAPVPGSGTNPLLLSGSMSIPLWFGKNSSRLRSGKLAAMGRVQTATAMINRKTAAAEKAINECEDSLRKIALYRNTLLPKSEESVQATEKAYAAGEADFMRLIDALRLRLRIELDIAASIASFHKARAALAALTGRRL